MTTDQYYVGPTTRYLNYGQLCQINYDYAGGYSGKFCRTVKSNGAPYWVLKEDVVDEMPNESPLQTTFLRLREWV